MARPSSSGYPGPSLKTMSILAAAVISLALFIGIYPRSPEARTAAPATLRNVSVVDKDAVCLFISDAGRLSVEAPRTPDMRAGLSFYSTATGGQNIMLTGDKHLSWLHAKAVLSGCAVLVEVSP